VFALAARANACRPKEAAATEEAGDIRYHAAKFHDAELRIVRVDRMWFIQDVE
jgi:hypothetical protein